MGPCRPICHEKDVGNKRLHDGRSRELQIMLRLVRVGVRPEDLVARFHWDVAPERVAGLEVDASRPEILARHLVTVDGRDVEVILAMVERPVATFLTARFSSDQINRLPIEAILASGGFVAVVECRCARGPRARIRAFVGSVTVMGSSGRRAHTMATSRDRTFEDGVGLSLDAQIDSDFFVQVEGRVNPTVLTKARRRHLLP
jgi:hypothetical protein